MTHPVLITGIGKRLGLETARHMLAQDIPVVGTYRTLREGVEELFDLGATLYQCDFYQADAVQELINVLTQEHPCFRAIIHNASDWIPESAELEASEIMTRMMAVHASVPYQINLALREHLRKGALPMSDIIHISDYVATTGSKKHIAYAASKAAMENLSLSFAAALAPEVKVNCIAPALMLFNPGDSETYREKALAKSLLQREGGTADFLNCIDYLLNSTYTTGRTLHLDGGRHLK